MISLTALPMVHVENLWRFAQAIVENQKKKNLKC